MKILINYLITLPTLPYIPTYIINKPNNNAKFYLFIYLPNLCPKLRLGYLLNNLGGLA
jgi:hypothetical protein